MKIILMQDVKSLGKKDEIVETSSGYARSLIGKKQAKEATAAALNDLKLKQKNQAKIEAQRLADAQELSEKLKGMQVELTLKGGTSDRVFGSVSSKEIAQAMEQQLGLEVDKKKLVMEEPIKTFGTHEVMLKLHPQVTASIRVKVIKEQQ